MSRKNSPSDFRPKKPLGDADIKKMQKAGDEYIKSVKSDPDAPQESDK